MDLNLLSADEVQALDERLRTAQHIIILAHSQPDGDALGSSLAWSNYLTAHYGKQPHFVVPNAFPDFLHWLPGIEQVVRYDKHPEQVEAWFNEADLIFCLDFNELSRTLELVDVLTKSTAERVLIDHHISPNVGSKLTLSFPELSSTSEIIFRIVWQLGGFDDLGKGFAVPVYCGMMTDTGGFTYNSSRPELYYIICQLLTKGIDKDKIYRNVFNNYSTWAIRLRGYVMSQKLNVFDDLHASYYTITRQDMKDFHFVRGDAEGLVNEPLRIKGMKCSISLREDDRIDNRVWVSLRSVDDFSVEEMARRFFNGGGHFNASGGRINGTIEDAVRITREAFNYYAEQLRKV